MHVVPVRPALSRINVLMCHDAVADGDEDDDNHHHDDDDDARFVGDQGASRLVGCMRHKYKKLARKSRFACTFF